MPTPGKAPSFADLFGRPPAVRAAAPGRVNLIGEHTDYNGGFVLPLTIPCRTTVELAPRPDATVRAWSADLPANGAAGSFILGSETRTGTWLDYLQGITRVLGGDGWRLPGFDARIASTVPIGAGLASSAALEVALLRALRTAFSLSLSDLDLARIGQRAENEFVGAQVGIMDQVAASLGQPGSGLFLDTRDLSITQVPLPTGADIIAVDSGLKHDHASGAYNTRRAECEQAASLLGVPWLRDVDDPARVERLPEPFRRRARHVVTENRRVLDTVHALRAGDLERVGSLLNASHASLRDDFEVSTPEIDLLVRLAQAESGVYGARLTGGGFGGAVLILAAGGVGDEVAARVSITYANQTGLQPRTLPVWPAPTLQTE